MPTRTVSPEEVRELRNDLGLTQKQLADALGVDRQTVLRWENPGGKPRPTGTAEAVLSALIAGPMSADEVRALPPGPLRSGYEVHRLLEARCGGDDRSNLLVSFLATIVLLDETTDGAPTLGKRLDAVLGSALRQMSPMYAGEGSAPTADVEWALAVLLLTRQTLAKMRHDASTKSPTQD